MPGILSHGPLPVPRNQRAEEAEKRVKELEALLALAQPQHKCWRCASNNGCEHWRYGRCCSSMGWPHFTPLPAPPEVTP